MIEGYMLKYKDIIWAVKGCFHPDNYAVAVPRYYNGIKIKKMNDAIKLVKDKFPFLMKYVPEIGFEVPLVPLDEAQVLDPFNAKICDEKVKRFLSFFQGKVGITGSLLYSLSYNDMDFLSLNDSHYFTLRKMREKGITKPLDFVNSDEVEIIDKENFKALKRERALEGIFEGTPYTFKIVKCVDFGIVIDKVEFKGIVRIVKAEKPFSLPVMYLTDKGYYITSFRTRFTEIKEGIVIYINGVLLKRDKFFDLDLDIAKEVKIV
ncbi:hypothetical protein SJAV_06560 [Sulfurisphaera javensis]|uniref:Nucleotidyltransferase n=1 Tax=Sulfurisphaera javensis TaxID=2049879 RepID=A0AAT9GPH1_9CREN